MHEQLPGFWQSVCGQASCSVWPEGLLPHHPDSQGQGGDFILLYSLFSLRRHTCLNHVCHTTDILCCFHRRKMTTTPDLDTHPRKSPPDWR